MFGGHATVNVAADGEVIFAGGSLVRLRGASGAAALDATDAVGAAADELGLDRPRNLRVLSRKGGAARRTVVSGGGISDEAIPARPGYQPSNGGLRLAWQLTIDDSSDSHLWNATVDAATGEMLDVDDWTSHDDVQDLEQQLSRTSAPEPAPAFTLTGVFPPTPVEDGSSYRVYNWPKESPNDGDRGLVDNPADTLASPFGWHDTDGADGPEFTITRGNNVHAYLD